MQVDGIWHTGIVIGGREYFFGQGIQHAPAGRTPFGDPMQILHLGDTEVPDELVQDFLADMSSTPVSYTHLTLPTTPYV